MKATTCECKRYSINFFSTGLFTKFLNGIWHETKSRNFSMLYNLLPESIDKVI